MDYVKTQDIREAYAFGELIGEGNFAKVYKAQNLEDPDLVVAIKSIKKTPDVDKFLQNECEILFKLEHENIIKIYEVYDNKDTFHIVMEYMEGKDLYDRYIIAGVRDERAICSIIKTLTEALDYCHKSGVVHRDLKPQNILLSTMNESASFKIADFGLARVVGDEMMTTACGTPSYLSPEIVSGQPYDKKADYWSLGILLYNLLSGSTPFSGKQAELFNQIKDAKISFQGPEWTGVSDLAKDLVAHLLKKNANERYDAAKIFAHPWVKCGGEVGMDIEK